MAKGQLDTVATQIWFDDEIAILTFGLKTGGHNQQLIRKEY